MVVKLSQSSNEQTPSSPVQLSALAGYQRFGDYLRIKRRQFGLLQREMAERFSLTAGMYGFLERERRAPQIDELVPMFAALVQLQNDKRLPPMQVIEAGTFFRLGKAIIEKKEKKRPNVTQQEWSEIEQQLINLVDHRQHNQIRLFVSGENDASSTILLESPDSRRRKSLKEVLKTDLSHLLEREAWVKRMLTYSDRIPHIKVSVTQAGMGAGKSHTLALLIQRLAERDDLFLIPYQFKHSETMTSDDHLDEFLATLHADLTMRVTDETKQRPLAERIDQILVAVRAYDQKVMLLLDDAQEMFPSAVEWSASWHQFFEAFISEPHTATLYMMTRVWPGWDERKRSFLEEEDLPDLSVEAGIQLWKRQGFDDVDDDLLQKVCERCGQNPQGIEMLAFQYKRRGFSINWKGSSRSTNENPHTTSLKKLLESETLFSGNLDETSRRTLQQVFSKRLSGEDLRLLECLALSPLGIPFDLLVDQFDYATQSYEEFIKASFADLNMAASNRAAVVPLVREAVVQSLTPEHKKEIEQLTTDIYARWLQDVQDFKDDAELAALIAEMVVRYIRQRQLLQAAELFISFGWLCTLFGHMARIQRVYSEVVRAQRGKEEDIKHEVGRLLLSYHIVTCSGQKISIAETDRMYQEVYDKVIKENITLQPHTVVNILHNIVLKYLDSSLFQEATKVFDEPFIHRAGLDIPEVYASYLHSKSRLYARWYEHEKRNGNNNDAQHLLGACVLTLKDCIAQWRLCLKNTLPLQEHYYNFRLARALTDYAYRQRLSGDLARAEEAVEEGIRLKKASAAFPQSLAVSLSEYSQILTVQGRNQLAEQFNGEAVQLMKHTIEETGNTTLNPELGMLLVERADIYLQQARLDETLPLLEQAVDLIGERKSRQSFREKAEKQIEEIRFIAATTRDYKLDKRWFAQFHDLALYDDLAWLAHAGPFSEDEQDEWNRLYPQREKEEVSDRLDALIVQSRQREFACSQKEHHAPHLCYPRIPLDEIQQRIAGFEQLRKDIHLQETNVVVRKLYLEKIDEEITALRRCEATALQDQDTVWKCDLALYGKPTEYEMTVALQPFCAMLLRAKQHEQAGPVAQELLTQLQSWGISPQEIAAIPLFEPRQEPIVSRGQSHEKRTFPHEVVQRFFQDVFDKEYRTSEWHVDIAPARDDPYVDINSRIVFLPPCSYSLNKIRELLAEEIETHAYRAMSGQRSPLALLGLGLSQYGPTEEGLAKHRIQQVSMQIHGKGKNNPWMGTLRTGLASGVMTPALSFLELSAFFEKAFLTNLLSMDSAGTREELLAEARGEAWIQAARAFRGIPNLHEAGCCSLKDRIYLRGYLDVIRFLETGNEECLYVGKIGIQHVGALAELHILKPYYPHRNLALSTDLLDRLSEYETH